MTYAVQPYPEWFHIQRRIAPKRIPVSTHTSLKHLRVHVQMYNSSLKSTALFQPLVHSQTSWNNSHLLVPKYTTNSWCPIRLPRSIVNIPPSSTYLTYLAQGGQGEVWTLCKDIGGGGHLGGFRIDGHCLAEPAGFYFSPPYSVH